MKNRKTKKSIDFIGPSVQDLGLTLESEAPLEAAKAADTGEAAESAKVQDTAKPRKKRESKKVSPITAVDQGEDGGVAQDKQDQIVEEKEVINKSNAIINKSNDDNVVDDNSGAKNPPPVLKRAENLYRRAIREYLEKTLGDRESVEFKISKMQEDLGVTMQTLYKHLRYLRRTEFEIKQIRYGSILKRRVKEAGEKNES
jgi:DNA-binding transcriptional ArsR family regulator